MKGSADSGVEVSFWDRFPWRRWVAGLAAATTLAGVLGGILLAPMAQLRVVQFMIPPYSYACLGLAIIALTELEEPLRWRIWMAVGLLAMTVLSVMAYSVVGVPPLLILGVHMGFLLGWIAVQKRVLWTLLWLVQAFIWSGIAWLQGRAI